MKRRDESIQAASTVFAENRARVRDKKQTLDEQAKRLEGEKGKNVSHPRLWLRFVQPSFAGRERCLWVEAQH